MKISVAFYIVSLSALGIVFLGGGVAVAWWQAEGKLRKLQNEVVEKQAVATALSVASQVAATRSVYSKHVVGSLKPTGVLFNPVPVDGEAPLPATFMMAVSEKLKQQKSGSGFFLRSAWNINKNQGIRTPFEKSGWADLLKQEKALENVAAEKRLEKYKPFYALSQNENGQPVMQVMTPDLASAVSCVACHNALENTAEVLANRKDASPKEFQLGGLMGAVVTSVPLFQTKAVMASFSDTLNDVSRNIWLLIGFGLVLALGLSVLLGHKISEKVRFISDNLLQISEGEGDLTKRLDSTAKDEFGAVANNFNSFLERVQQFILDVSAKISCIGKKTEEMNSLTGQIASASLEMSGQSESANTTMETLAANLTKISGSSGNVSSTISSVAAAIEEMSASLSEVAGSCSIGSRMSQETDEKVRRAGETMSVLNDSAVEINKVIAAISDIADQTNLLALNAPPLRLPVPEKRARVSPLWQVRSRHSPSRLLWLRKKSGSLSARCRIKQKMP